MSTLKILAQPPAFPAQGITRSSVTSPAVTKASVAPALWIQGNRSSSNGTSVGILVHLTPITRVGDTLDILINPLNPKGSSTVVHTETLTLQRLTSLLDAKLSRIGIETQLKLSDGDYAMRYLQRDKSGTLAAASLSTKLNYS